MPKSRLALTVIPDQYFSSISSGTYTFPGTITFDSVGKITNITTAMYVSSPLGLNSVLTSNTDVFQLNTSTGDVIVNLVPITSTATFRNVASISVDSYGRIITATTVSDIIAAGTVSPIASIQTTGTGQILQISTSTIGAFQNRSSTVTNFSINAPMYNTPGDIVYSLGISGYSIIDLSLGSFFVILGNFSTAIAGFSNVPTDRNRITTLTISMSSSSLTKWDYGGTTGFRPADTTLTVNGTSSPIYWLDRNKQYPYSGHNIFSISILCDSAGNYSIFASQGYYF